MKQYFRLIAVLIIAFSVILYGQQASAAKKVAAPENLKTYIDDLKSNPQDTKLRETIIKLALGMRRAPALPEEAERSMARGAAFFAKAADVAGYKKAIAEFEEAANAAPWLALAYYNLGVVQEKAGMYVEAIQSLTFYLMAAPKAKNAREVKNKIYALEVDAEDLQAGQNVPIVSADAATAASLAGSPSLEIEPEQELKIIKLPKESKDKKSKVQAFLGKWYFYETIRKEKITIQAFEIAQNATGDFVLNPPKRAGGSYATVNIFEINDQTLKLQMKWKMRSVVGYWKTETYVLTLSADGLKLTGAHNQRSVGGRNIDMDRTLLRQ